MENIVIRQGKQEDCPKIYELIKELAIYEKTPNGVKISLKELQDCGFGNNPIWSSFVAEINGEVVGAALYYDRFSTWKGRRFYLEDLIVTEKMRGQGIGKIIFDKIIAYAKNNNYSGMVWQVLDWNKPAINFYKKYNSNFEPEWVNASIDFKTY